MEEDILAKFRHDSIAQLTGLKPLDVVPFDYSELPENYTLVARPDDATIEQICNLQKKLQTIEPNHYYYPSSQLHLTLIGLLPSSLDVTNVIDVVSDVLKKYDLKFRMKGVGSNKYCTSVSAYPLGFSIHQLREEIRAGLEVHGDDFATHLDTYEYMGWVNYMRYTKTPSEKLLEAIRSYIDTDLGMMVPRSVELYLNKSKILAPGGSKLIKIFEM